MGPLGSQCPLCISSSHPCGRCPAPWHRVCQHCQRSSMLSSLWVSVSLGSLSVSISCFSTLDRHPSSPCPPLLWAGCRSVPSWANTSFPPHRKVRGRPGLVMPRRLPHRCRRWSSAHPSPSPEPPSVHLDFSSFILPFPSCAIWPPHPVLYSHSQACPSPFPTSHRSVRSL